MSETLPPLPLVFSFDLETVAFPHCVTRAGFIEIYAEVLDPNKPGWPVVATFHRYVKPDMDNAQVDTIMWHHQQGLTLTEMQERGISEARAIAGLVAFLEEHSTRDADGKLVKMIPAGHNIGRFDCPILWRSAFVCGYDMDKFLDHHMLDTCVLAYTNLVFRAREIQKVSLHKLATHLGIVVDTKQQHKAKYDMEITNQVLRTLMGVPKTLEQVFAAEDAKHGA